MHFTLRGAVIVVSIALLATVATQLFYIGVVSPSDSAVLRKVTWTSEMILFSLVAWAALPLAARGTMPLVWSAVAIAGLVNLIQVGMGLLEFPQAQQAADEQVFKTVLNGAFFLYFHGKMMLGIAAIGLGLAATRLPGAFSTVMGWASIASGIATAILSIYGMANGMELVFATGAAGTAATALLAMTGLIVVKEP
ncbi:MAG: hypothetical protein HKO05_06510 [Erythrobacter sp.]|nr:hypothetical protein [Erythrobacter sp.]